MHTHQRFASTKADEENAPVNRRTAVARLSALAAVAGWPEQTETAPSQSDVNTPPTGEKLVRKIATEEAFMMPEVTVAD